MQKDLNYINKLKELNGRLNKTINVLEDNVYDFSNCLINEFDIEKISLNFANFEKEQIIQQDMERQARVLIKEYIDKSYEEFSKSSIYDGCLEEEYYYYHFSKKFRIKSYNNYYHIWFDGCEYDSFVFDKLGNLVFRGNNVVDADDSNFIGLKYDRENFDDRAYHYEFKNGKFELVKVLNDVHNVEVNKYFNDNLLIFVTSDEYMLYNYENKEVVIPSFSVCTNVETKDLDNQDIFVMKKIFVSKDNYPEEVAELGYFVDKNGILNYAKTVCNLSASFFTGNYLLKDFGNSQEESLRSIYSKVRDDYKKKCGSKKKILKKKNRENFR